MRILLLYTPRSGSTSILRYFQKLNPNYKVINQPWSDWNKTKKLNLESLSQYDNLFVKNEISWIVDLEYETNKDIVPTIFELNTFFDKIIILSRKNIEEQSLSLYFSEENDSHLYSNYQIYDISSIKKDKYNFLKNNLIRINNILDNNFKNKFSHYYYEDLYFNSFDDLFKELNIPYNEKYFNQILDKSKKYKVGEINKNKQTKSII